MGKVYTNRRHLRHGLIEVTSITLLTGKRRDVRQVSYISNVRGSWFEAPSEGSGKHTLSTIGMGFNFRGIHRRANFSMATNVLMRR